MSKLLCILLALGIFVGGLFGAGEVTYTCGSTTPVPGEFTKFWADTVRLKAAAAWNKDTLWDSLVVPGNKTAYNLKMWALNPDSREESLQVVVKFNNSYQVTAATDADSGNVWPISDFGYDSKADTIYYNSLFSKIYWKAYTSTAGGDAGDSLMHIYLQFVTEKSR